MRQGTALSVPVLHEEGQVLVEYVRARATNAQGQEAADYRSLQAAVASSLLKMRIDDGETAGARFFARLIKWSKKLYSKIYI